MFKIIGKQKAKDALTRQIFNTMQTDTQKKKEIQNKKKSDVFCVFFR